MISQTSCSTVGDLRPPKILEYAVRSTRYSACGSTAAVFGFEGSVLVAPGLVIDEIDSIAGSGIAQGVRSTERHAQPHEGARSPTETLESICRSLVIGRGDRYLCYPMPTVQFYNDFLNLCLLLITESPHVVNKEFREWFRSMASLCFNGQSFENVLRSVQDEKTAALAHLPPNQDEYIQDSFYGRFFDVSVRMSLRLMSSYKGRVGTVPAKATTGDLVCILYGCSVPMLLRKRKDEERFTIVGECYLDGFMNGEALKQADASEVMFQII